MHDGILRIAGAEQNFQVRPQLHGFVGKLPPVHAARHHDVGEQQGDVLPLADDVERARPVRRACHLVSKPLQLRGQVLEHGTQRCSHPYALLSLTRTAVTVNGPARSVEVYGLVVSWAVHWNWQAYKNLCMVIHRTTTITTEGLPTATVRRRKRSVETVNDVTEMITVKDLVEATDEIISILTAHTPP